jgi:four helix bundle protein
MENQDSTIRTFKDLRVYQNVYKAMLRVMKEITPKLPDEEKFDLKSQMNRACKAPPALLAEGFAKRYQVKQWRKYLDDCIGECYEMINHLQVCVDVYPSYIDPKICTDVIELYNYSCRQLYKLKQSWQNFHDKS